MATDVLHVKLTSPCQKRVALHEGALHIYTHQSPGFLGFLETCRHDEQHVLADSRRDRSIFANAEGHDILKARNHDARTSFQRQRIGRSPQGFMFVCEKHTLGSESCCQILCSASTSDAPLLPPHRSRSAKHHSLPKQTTLGLQLL